MEKSCKTHLFLTYREKILIQPFKAEPFIDADEKFEKKIPDRTFCTKGRKTFVQAVSKYLSVV